MDCSRPGFEASMDRLVYVILLLLSVVTSRGEGAPVKGYGQPADCKSIECAPYKVLYSQKEFEIRSYGKVNWVATKPINSSSYSAATQIGFDILFAYIQGKNVEGAKIEMTAPVLVDIVPSTGPFCNSTFVVHFYVPAKYQSNPPQSAEVRTVALPRKPYAAVRRFGGFMDDKEIAVNAAALRQSLRKSRWEPAVAASEKASGKGYSVAGYNSPFEYTGRVNEVIFWF